MHKLKAYVRNKARPEGSIAEGYIDNECLLFCSLYYSEMDTIWNKPDRNYDVGDSIENTVSVFQPKFRCLGRAFRDELSTPDWEKIRWYVLNNCVEVHPFLRYFSILHYQYFLT